MTDDTARILEALAQQRADTLAIMAQLTAIEATLAGIRDDNVKFREGIELMQTAARAQWKNP